MARWSGERQVSRDPIDTGEAARTVLVTLDLDDHLLEAPDGLLAALLGHLLLDVVLGLLDGRLLELVELLLLLFLLLSVMLVVKLVQSRVGVTSLLGLVNGTLSSANRDGCVLVDRLLQRAGDVVLGQVGGLVPGVVLSGSIDLGKGVVLVEWC